MQIEAIPMLINSDFMEIPLDKRLDLADYKMYGEKSHVFQNKDRLHSLYECIGLTMNDLTIYKEAFEHLAKNNKVGVALASIYGIKNVQTLATLTTMQEVVASTTAMQAVTASTIAMQAVMASTTAMTAVANSSTAMTVVANSSVALAKIISSPTAINALSNSKMRTRLTNKQEVKNGLMLVMDMGKGSYITSDFNNITYGHIRYVDGSFYPPEGSYYENDPLQGEFGYFLKKVPKVANYVRTYSYDETVYGRPPYIDVILIKGSVTNVG